MTSEPHGEQEATRPSAVVCNVTPARAQADSANKKQDKHVLSVAEIDRILRDRLAMRRRVMYGTIVRGVMCMRLVKLFLYGWGVILVLAGLCALGLGAYLRFMEVDGRLAPYLAVAIVALAGLGLTFVSGGSIYGLQQHRQCVTDGRRNYVLGLCVVLSLVGAAAAVTGGAMAFVLDTAVSRAQDSNFSSSRVRSFEATLVSRLAKFIDSSSSGWERLQQELSCCGYSSVQEFSTSSQWDASFVSVVKMVNRKGSGSYCSSTACEVSDSDDGAGVCPVPGAMWCRSALLELMRSHYHIVGIAGVSLGGAQLLHGLFGLFTLLFDVRTLARRSPKHDVPHHSLAPIQSREAPLSP